MSHDREATTIYRVLVNNRDEYSIVPIDGVIPDGWRDAWKEGPKAECLAFIDRAWTDMRPRSVRLAMDAAALR
jgi:MbtH protein